MEKTNTEVNNKRNQTEGDFAFEIVRSVAELGTRKKSGFVKELNLVSYRGLAPKWDLREWNEDHTRMSKGITLNDNELAVLKNALATIEN